MKILLILILTTSTFAQIPDSHRKRMEAAAPAKPSIKPKQPRKVLIFITPPHLMDKDPHKGYCIPYGAAAFEILGRQTGAYEPVVSDDLASFFPERILDFDAIVLNNASGPWMTPTAEQMKSETFTRHGADAVAVEQLLRKTFLEWLSSGRGAVCIHFAIAANRQWPQFAQLIGGRFTGHPWNEEIGVTVEDARHPLAAAFDGKDFRIADEIYEYGQLFDRGKCRVLLSLDPARSNMGVKWITRQDGDFALAWIKNHEKGRVFNTSFGHRTEIYHDPRILRFYLDAVQFATGDLEAPTDPIPAPRRDIKRM